MPIIFLLPFLLFAVMMAALWAAHVSEMRQRARAVHTELGTTLLSTGEAHKPFTIIRLADAFEPETSMLWETQMPALELIAAAGRRGLAVTTLARLYLRSAALYPELYEGAEFESWLQFLAQAQLIYLRQEGVAITPGGIEFLKCRVAAKAVA